MAGRVAPKVLIVCIQCPFAVQAVTTIGPYARTEGGIEVLNLIEPLVVS
jgi:hypothetical protein